MGTPRHAIRHAGTAKWAEEKAETQMSVENLYEKKR
jgi:hypothetical protein